LLLKQDVNNKGLLVYDVISKNNRSKLSNYSFNVDQYLENLKATLDLKVSYDYNKREYLLNNEPGWMNYKIYTINPGFSVNRWRKIDLAYSYYLRFTGQKSEQANLSICEQKHESNIFYTPQKNHLFGITLHLYDSKQKGQNNSTNLFVNFSYHLKPLKGKFKYKLEVRNILNRSQIVNYFSSDISLVRSSYEIRPRQILFTISYGL
jgi:hypothetical protein